MDFFPAEAFLTSSDVEKLVDSPGKYTPTKPFGPKAKQQFLLENFNSIRSFHEEQKYQHLITVDNGVDNLSNRINKFKTDEIEEFLNIEGFRASYLVPYIKMFYKPKDSESETEIMFDGYYSQEHVDTITFMNNSTSGVGLKSVSLKINDQLPSDVNIMCNVELFYDSLMSMMNTQHKNLFVVPAKKSDYNAKDYRIKMIFGWAVPHDPQEQLISRKLKNIIQNNLFMLNLELLNHTISFEQNGTVKVDINYQAAYSVISDSRKANVLRPRYLEGVSNWDEILAPALQKANELLSNPSLSDSEKERLKLERDRYEELLTRANQTQVAINYRTIVERINTSDRMFLVKTKVSEGDVFEIATKPKPVKTRQSGQLKALLEVNTSRLNIFTDDPRVEAQWNEFDQALEKSYGDEAEFDPTQLNIVYTTFGAILDEMVKLIVKDETGHIDPDEIPRIILGTLNYTNNFNVPWMNTSMRLVDFPIDMEFFNIWFVTNVVRQKAQTLTLFEFIKKFIDDIIRDHFIKLQSYQVSSTTQSLQINLDSIYSFIKHDPGEELNIEQFQNMFENAYSSESGNLYSYYIINMYYMKPSQMTGNYDKDLELGIYHFPLGNSKGLLKSVSFSKMDDVKMQDARIVGQNMNTSGEVLKLPYNIKMNMIGNNLIKKGSYFYIDATIFGQREREAVNAIGLGGYYICTGVQHKIEPGKFETQIDGTFQSFSGE